MTEDKNKLLEDSLFFLTHINDAIPLLSLKNKEKAVVLRDKWKQQYDLLEQECVKAKQKQSEISINEIEVLSPSKPVQKPTLLEDPFPRLKERFRELSANIRIGLECIEERAHDYKKTNKHKKLIDRFKSASDQVYAAVYYLKNFLNIKSDLTMTVLLEKIIEQVETEAEENQTCLDIDLLKKEIARCLEPLQWMVDKVKELKDKLTELKQEKEALILRKKDENFSFSTIKKMAKIVRKYEVLKDQFSFLNHLTQILSMDDRLESASIEMKLLYALLDDLDAFKDTYYALDKHRHLLCNVADFKEIRVEKASESATKQDEPVEEKQPISLEESDAEIESSYETPVCHEANKSLDEAFENWKNQVGIEINQVINAITIASDALLDRLYPLFVRILQHYQQKIAAKQSECLEKPSTQASVSYCQDACVEIERWINYMHCRLYYFSSGYQTGRVAVEGNNRQYLFFQNNDGAKDSVESVNMADYLVVAMKVNHIQQQIAVEEKRQFNHSQSFIKPLCQSDNVYAEGFAGLDNRVFEASEQMFKVSQLKRHLALEKAKKQTVFEQLAKKIDYQALKNFIKRVDPSTSFEFVSTPMVVYAPVLTSANFYQRPMVSVVDSGYSSHADSSNRSTPP